MQKCVRLPAPERMSQDLLGQTGRYANLHSVTYFNVKVADGAVICVEQISGSLGYVWTPPHEHSVLSLSL